MSNKKKVLVGLSGGVDSAVSAYLLKEQGYEVTAGFMKNYADESNPNCQTREDRNEAIKVAQYLGIQDFIIFDFRKEYDERIINYIYEGYKQGITPNPDILCNNLVKFDLFLDKALSYGFDYIATGHYARINTKNIPGLPRPRSAHSLPTGRQARNDEVFQLLRGVDHNKDQSYFLSGLNQYQLSKSLFPLGEMTKPEGRELAKKIGLPNAERKDSQGLCFVGNVPMKEFLQKKLPLQKGDILLENGIKVGEHDGAWFFTIGQSRGLDINIKAYVTSIDVTKNIIVVSYERETETLLHIEAKVHDRHWIADTYPLPCDVTVKIRYRQDPLVAATLSQGEGKNDILVTFSDPQRGIASGQHIVAYDGEVCLGGGIIV